MSGRFVGCFAMSVDPLVAPLLRVDLFQGLKALQITEIARRAERMVFRVGDTITRLGDDADAAFLIVAGSAEWMATDETRAAEPIEICSLIGEMAMLIEHQYGATVVARGPVRCLKLGRTMMHELMLADAGLAEHLTAKIVQRLNQTAATLREIDEDLSIETNEPSLEATDAVIDAASRLHN